jgi:phospholipid/cholesterol/gamma-HCH transport system substrate-binding protein
VLVEAQGIGADVHGATGDLGNLRADVEANLRKIEGMMGELNRKWPFARETEVKLP